MTWIVQVFHYWHLLLLVSFEMGQLKAAEVEVSRVKNDKLGVTEGFYLDSHVSGEVECAEIRVQKDVVVAGDDVGRKSDVIPGEALPVRGGGRRRGLDLRGERRPGARDTDVLGGTGEGGDQRDADDDEAEDEHDEGGRALAAHQLLAPVGRIRLVHVPLARPSVP